MEFLSSEDSDSACETVHTFVSTLHGINGCESVDEEVVRDWLNEDKNLPGHEVLNDAEIIQHVTGDVQNETSPCDEDELIPEQRISHNAALTHVEALLDYLEREEDSKCIDKVMLRNLRSTIR